MTIPFRYTLILLTSLLPLAAEASFSINYSFQGGLSSSQQDIFNDAKATWESYINGYQSGITLTGIDIDAKGEAMDGEGGLLGSAGPTSGTSQGGYFLATVGSMTFDTADLDALETEGRLESVITHELAHVFGFGTLWDPGFNNLYIDGTGEYTGAFALDAYQDEFDPLATYVPVELSGGGGTADGHWNENDGGIGTTGITDQYGRDMADELMTGWLGSNPNDIFISNTTLGALQDLGFTVDMPIPEPGSAVLTGLAFVGLGLTRRRSQSR